MIKKAKAGVRILKKLEGQDESDQPFEAADYLDSDEVIAEYLNAALEDPNPNVFLTAISDVAKARGRSKLTDDAG